MVISKTPMRISFVGGGSDLAAYYKKSPGAVVSTAIDKHVYVFANRRFGKRIRVAYWRAEFVDSVDKVKHDLVREALKLSGIDSSVDISYMGDVQVGKEGTGLGASSSITVGTLNSLYVLNGNTRSAEQLANDACKIEIERLGRTLGKQDQYAASYGGLNYIQFNPDGFVEVEPIKLTNSKRRELENKFLLFFVGQRDLSESILSKQKRNVSKKGKKRDGLSKMVSLAKQARKDLKKGKISSFGEMLHENWFLKKKLAGGISNSHIDEYYEEARKNGAIGGKICGAGGGGFLLLFAPEKKHTRIISALSPLRRLEFAFEPEGSKIVYAS